MTWVILVVDALMLIWLISAAATSTSDGCTGDYADACRSGAAAGKGIAIVLIIFVAAAMNVILGVIWLVTRSSWKAKQDAKGSRPCPYCAELVQKEAVVCRHCSREIGFSIGSSRTSRPSAPV